MTEKKSTLVPVSFYFIRHGQTDWNKTRQELCNYDDIPLNEAGVFQATNVCKYVSDLGITHMYASPLARAKQTAEIINRYLNVPMTFHEGLRKITDLEVVLTCQEIMKPGQTTVIVSHGEVYRVLIRILDAQTVHLNAKNCGLYFFKAPDKESDRWIVLSLSDGE